MSQVASIVQLDSVLDHTPVVYEGEPLPHFSGRLVRKRDGQNIFRAYPAVFNQMGNAAGQGPGFSGSGPGGDQQGPVSVSDRFQLVVIQAGQYIGFSVRFGWLCVS